MLPPNSLHAKVGPKLLDMKTRPQLAYDENKVDKKSISSGNRPLKISFFHLCFFRLCFFHLCFFRAFLFPFSFFLFPSLTSLITLLCLYSVLHVLFSFINQSFGVWFIPSKSCVERNIPQSEIGAEWRVASYKFRVESVQC